MSPDPNHAKPETLPSPFSSRAVVLALKAARAQSFHLPGCLLSVVRLRLSKSNTPPKATKRFSLAEHSSVRSSLITILDPFRPPTTYSYAVPRIWRIHRPRRRRHGRTRSGPQIRNAVFKPKHSLESPGRTSKLRVA